jgi:hypothetical protein
MKASDIKGRRMTICPIDTRLLVEVGSVSIQRSLLSLWFAAIDETPPTISSDISFYYSYPSMYNSISGLQPLRYNTSDLCMAFGEILSLLEAFPW